MTTKTATPKKPRRKPATSVTPATPPSANREMTVAEHIEASNRVIENCRWQTAKEHRRLLNAIMDGAQEDFGNVPDPALAHAMAGTLYTITQHFTAAMADMAYWLRLGVKCADHLKAVYGQPDVQAAVDPARWSKPAK